DPPPNVQPDPADPESRSLLITPIELGERHYGNLVLTHHEVGHFPAQDVELYEGLANQLAITLNRLDAVEQQQQLEKQVAEAEAMTTLAQSTYEVTHGLGNDLGLIPSR